MTDDVFDDMARDLAKTGGPAFPPHHDPRRHPSGMTLRDYFAGQALPTILAALIAKPAHETAPFTQEERAAGVARASYEIADAMLAEKDKS